MIPHRTSHTVHGIPTQDLVLRVRLHRLHIYTMAEDTYQVVYTESWAYHFQGYLPVHLSK